MFKVRPIRTCAKFEPVKESEAQIPSVELITELVKVELQELCFYVMVRVQYAPFGIADGNVHPRQNFPDTLFVIRNYGMVGGCHSVLFKSGITAEPVRGHIGVSVRPRLYLARDGGSLKIADDQHLYMPDSFGRTVLSGRRRSGPAAFGHDKDGSLALASTPSLQRRVLLVFRSFGGKEALVHFHIPMKGVKAVAPAHHIAQLMHHFPYGLVTLAAELALYLLCRYGTPGSRQQEHGRKPITHRKMAALHDRARTKLHLMFAIHASPGLMARIPAQAQTAALAAEQTVVFTETTQCSLAGGLVWVLTVKIKQGHIIYVFIVHTSRIKHKVFQYTPIGHLGGLNFANLGTCGHSYNLFNFIRIVIPRLTRDLPRPFSMEGVIRKDDTPQHKAVREAVTNMIIHADFMLNGILRVEKFDDRFVLTNPGLLKLPIEQIYAGGESKSRNQRMQNMLRMIGYGENLGSGFPLILSAWNEKHWLKPELIEQLELMQVKLVLHIENDKNVTKDVTKDVTKEMSERQMIILGLIRENKNLTIPEMSLKTNVTERTIKRDIATLQELGIISREGGRKDGSWIIKQDEE